MKGTNGTGDANGRNRTDGTNRMNGIDETDGMNRTGRIYGANKLF